MTANQEIPGELHVKICKKIAQLTKIIYTLNTKAELQDGIIKKVKKDYADEIQQIMLESKANVMKYKDDCLSIMQKEKAMASLQGVLENVKEENSRLRKTLEEYSSNAELNEKQLRNCYENKFLDLRNKFLERKRDYSELNSRVEQCCQDIRDKNQKGMVDVTQKHQEEALNLKLTYERNLEAIRIDHLQSEKSLKDKLEKLQLQTNVERKQFEDEYEAKLTKLKQFYDNELKLYESNKKEVNEKEWDNEKAQLIKKFNSTKKGLDDQIHSLEKKLSEKKDITDSLEQETQSLQAESRINLDVISDLQRKLVARNEQITILENEFGELLKKSSLLEEQLSQCAVKHGSDYKVLESAYEDASKALIENKGKLNALELKYSSMHQNNKELEKVLEEKLEENSQLHANLSIAVDEKATEVKKSKTLEGELEEKDNLINKLELKCREVEEVCHIEKENELKEQSILKKNVDNLLSKHEIELNSIKYLYDMKIKEVEDEVRLLKDSIEKHICIICEKEDLIQKNANDLNAAESKLEEYRKKLDVSYEKTVCLKNELEDANRLIRDASDKCKQYEIQLFESQHQLQNLETEKSKSVLDLKEMKLKMEREHNDKILHLEKFWQLKLRAAHENNEKSILCLEKEAKSSMDAIQLNHSNELSLMKQSKDEEIESFQEEVREAKSSMEKLEYELMQEKKQNDSFSQKVNMIQAEKEKLIESHKIENVELRGTLKCELENQRAEFEKEKMLTINSLNHDHDGYVMELRNEHSYSLKALKSHLLQEHQANINLLKERLSEEKDTLHRTMELQTQERIEKIIKDHTKETDKLKKDITQTEEYYQDELAAHSKKTNKLLNAIESEKENVEKLKHKLEQVKEEVHSLCGELESKGEEILEIRRESNARFQIEVEKLKKKQSREIEHMNDEHYRELYTVTKEWEEKLSKVNDEISTLKMALEEAEEKYLKRPSRIEDIERINELTQKVFECDIEYKKVNDERKIYRMELVNREENFNKVFNASPNVGYIDPIALSKRKSSKKR